VGHALGAGRDTRWLLTRREAVARRPPGLTDAVR
jgi:hypothetical protein